MKRRKVFVAVLDPQGSMGGFEWRNSEAAAAEAADEIGRDLILGIVPVKVPGRLAPKEVTRFIDSILDELEQGLRAA